MSGKVLVKIQRAETGEWEVASLNENLRTEMGINQQALQMGVGYDGTGTAGPYIQIALTQNTDAPAASDVSLDDEIGADGLSRKTATYAHTADQSSYTQTATWQNSGSVYTITKAAMCTDLTDTGASTDTCFAVTALSPVAVLDSADTLSIAWGIFY